MTQQPNAPEVREFSFPNTATRRIFAAADILFHFCDVACASSNIEDTVMSMLFECNSNSKFKPNARYTAYVLSQLADAQSEHFEDLKKKKDVRVYLSQVKYCFGLTNPCSFSSGEQYGHCAFNCVNCYRSSSFTSDIAFDGQTEHPFRIVWKDENWRLILIN
jgi:hypothetical protein